MRDVALGSARAEAHHNGDVAVAGEGLQKDSFNNRLDFKTKVIPYIGDDSWIEPSLFSLKSTLMDPNPPKETLGCEFCSYIKKNLTL